MVKHIVLWKIRQDSRTQKNIDHMIDILTDLVGKIDGLISMEVGHNFNTDSDYDVVLYATFRNATALRYYQNHPEHLKCKEFISQISVSRTAADYFYEDSMKSVNTSEKSDMHSEKEKEPAAAPVVEVTPVKNKPAAPVIEVTPVKNEPAVAPRIEVTPVKKPVVAAENKKAVSPEGGVAGRTVSDENPEVKQRNTPGDKTKTEKHTDKPVSDGTINTAAPIEGGDTWTCPNCGKVMPKYVGTCGCGEPQPFNFDTPPALQPTPVAPVEEPKPEKKSMFAAKPKVEKNTDKPVVSDGTINTAAPIEGGDTWTCPNCGKVMPKYVGTCGCGEPQPFNFDTPPALQSAPVAPVEEPKPEKKSVFGSKPKAEKHTDVPVSDGTINTAAPIEGGDTWTCPNCGKVMPKYVGTCGCGEPQPFNFDTPPALQPAPVASVEKPKPEKKSIFAGKPKAEKHPDVPVSDGTINTAAPIEGGDTWTCPNCGKVMPKYVGTCGCGEPQPFNFDTPPVLQSAPVAPVEEPKPEKKSIFAAKPKAEKHPDVPVSDRTINTAAPIEGGDTWTCPNCGKVMPKYVGTCGCGEPQPFNFDTPPALQSAPVAPVEEPKPEKKSVFGSKPKAEKHTDVPVSDGTINTAAPIEGGDTWTCPNCGKVMPMYVGTCGCGEPQPFNLNDANASAQYNKRKSVTDISSSYVKADDDAGENYEYDSRLNDESEFYLSAPSIESYSPQTSNNKNRSYINNANADVSVEKPFGKKNSVPAENKGDSYVSGFNSGNVPPAAPMRFSDIPPAKSDDGDIPGYNFDNVPPPAPMRYSDIADGSQTDETVQSKVSSNTWTCPNCGRVMPKYVGTCGCGTPQPFDV